MMTFQGEIGFDFDFKQNTTKCQKKNCEIKEELLPRPIISPVFAHIS
jgi:hypothetical protein